MARASAYPAHRYDKQLVLKVPALLWLAMLFLVRHGVLVLLSFLPRTGDSMSYLRDLVEPWFLLSDLPAAMILLAAVRRKADAPGWAIKSTQQTVPIAMTNRKFETPEAAENAFYRAFRTIDLELMDAVWADGDKPLCIHPGSGLLQGKPAVMQSWMEIFAGGKPPIIEHEYKDGFAAKGLVVRLVEERIRPREEPATAANRLLATNIYLRVGGFWLLAEHHASLPLVERGNDTRAHRQLH